MPGRSVELLRSAPTPDRTRSTGRARVSSFGLEVYYVDAAAGDRDVTIIVI